MCGIFGYVGDQEAAPIVLEGLRRLEYRGYDSAGVAVIRHDAMAIRRSVGKLVNLRNLLAESPLQGSVGVGHTRWATHGGPSESNAHPHTDCSGRLAVVHNGIIENYSLLREALKTRGHHFTSQTDTEVLTHLIEEKAAGLADIPGEKTLLEAVRLALLEVCGAYAIAVLWAKAPGSIVAAKSASPLVIGLGTDGNYMASDVPAFLKHTRRAVFLEDGELALLGAQDCSFFDLSGARVEKLAVHIQWDHTMAEKGGYRHFMLKEIHEQPAAVENTLRGRLPPLNTLERETGLSPEVLRGFNKVHLVACGTAHHAGLVGKYLLERHARIPAQVETASEFRYRSPLIEPDTLVIAVSQSGETADTIAAVRLARQAGAKVLAVCNTLGATLTRCSDFTFNTYCGSECGVASTKAFIGQLVALDLITLHLALARGAMSEQEGLAWVSGLRSLPGLISAALKLEEPVLRAARHFLKAQHFLYIGRTLNYPTAVEGALKLKELSYIHAEGYPAGEMKHGPLALVDCDMPVLAIATRSEVFDKMLSNIEEARARGAQIIAVVTQGESRLRGKTDFVLEVPDVAEPLGPAVNIIPLQLLAYHIADLKGCDVDQPRNLAKSVTVE